MRQRRTKSHKLTNLSTFSVRRLHTLDQVGRLLCLASAGAIGVLAFAILFPAVMENSFAEPITLADNEAALLTTNIDVQSAISLAVKQQLDFEITPHSSGSAFNKGVTTLNVNTNTDAGYNLYIHTTNEDGKLHNSREGITDTLNPISAGVTTTSDNMPANTWGYSSDGINYQAVPTTSTKIPGSEGVTTSKTYNISIGAKIDLNIAAGSYQGNVIFSTVANPIIIEKIGWDTIKTMQQMTPEICAEAPVWKSAADTRVLLDDRGPTPRKQYNVAKLKDNNCWMQEDLALNLGFEMTGSDTDLAPGTKKTLPVTTTASVVSQDDNGLQSRHPNNYWYYQWNAATAESGLTTTTPNTEVADSICPRGWRLPTSGPNYNTITTSGNPTNKIGSGSYYDLFTSYGIMSTGSAVAAVGKAPLNFTLVGHVNSNSSNSPAWFGTESYYWSQMTGSTSTDGGSFNWYANGSVFQPSTAYRRAYAFAVRCVARIKPRVN